MKVNVIKLEDAMNQCLEYSADARFKLDQQKIYLAQGEALRDRLVEELGKNFKAELDPSVSEANRKLQDINTALGEATQSLDKYADSVAKITQVFGVLDKLINIAGGAIA